MANETLSMYNKYRGMKKPFPDLILIPELLLLLLTLAMRLVLVLVLRLTMETVLSRLIVPAVVLETNEEPIQSPRWVSQLVEVHFASVDAED